MTFWADNIKFIKDISDSKYKKIEDAIIEVRMEFYTTPSQLWRAAIYCGTLWLPLPLSRLFLSLFLNFEPNLV